MDYKVILWDFDGVILDSMDVRDLGFEVILKDYPNAQVVELMRYHRANGGLSRYVKFRYFFETIRGEEITDEKVNEWAQQFSDVMLRELPNKEHIISETLEFIQRQYYAGKEQHIVSGSDQTELRVVCERLEISKYFKSINGSPTHKSKLISNLLLDEGYAAENVILIGDSKNDWEAAIQNGIGFYGYNNEDLKSYSENYIDSFEEWSLP